MNNSNYLIIAGISKAGTTSLFDYLTEHPEIEGSYIKQTYFFLDKELQKSLNIHPLYDYTQGYELFDRFFEGKKLGKYKVEATPDYFYSPNTAKRLKEFFNSYPGKLIIILREPVSRFISFFYFGKQQGAIPEDMGFETFYETAKQYSGKNNTCLMAYDTGFYSQPIQNYIDELGQENVLVLFFEDLRENPQQFMKNLCFSLGIDGSIYETFDFKIKNKTVKVKSKLLSNIYGSVREWYIQHFYKNRVGVFLARIAKKTITPLYKSINHGKLKAIDINPQTKERLSKDYYADKMKLQKVLNTRIPW